MASTLEIMRHLKKARERRTLSHAYIVHGQSDRDRYAIIGSFVQILLCERHEAVACGTCVSCARVQSKQHPDVLIVGASGARSGVIGVDAIRNAVHFARLSRTLSDFKVIILFGAEQLNKAAANALLKTLEEPLHDVILFLDTPNLKNIMQTIVSRCQLLRLDSIHQSDSLISELGEEKRALMFLAGSLEDKLKFVKNFIQDVKDTNPDITSSGIASALLAFSFSIENVLRRNLLGALSSTQAKGQSAADTRARSANQNITVLQTIRALEATRQLRIILADHVNPYLAFESLTVALAL